MPPVSRIGPSDRPLPVAAIAIIPARYRSSRLPGKALADIGGHPMIEHVYWRAAAARSVQSVIVATDDARIFDAVHAFGGLVRMTSTEHPSGTDRIAEVAADLECDVIVNVQGDEPLVHPAMIDEVIAPFAADPELTMCTLRRRLNGGTEAQDPNVTKVVVDRENHALYFSRAPIPFSRHGCPPAPVWRHVGLYAYRRDALLRLATLPPTPLERSEALEQLRALEYGMRIKVLETMYDSVGVDTAEDLERARRLMPRLARA